MLLAMKIKVAATVAALASPIALTVAPAPPTTDHAVHSGITEISAATFDYRVAGDFSRDGKPVAAPQRVMRLGGSLKIMDRQVTAGEYAACANDGGCPRLGGNSPGAERSGT